MHHDTFGGPRRGVEDARREWRAEMNREMRDMIDWIDVGMEEELKG